MSTGDRVFVAVRCRPMSEKEKLDSRKPIVDILKPNKQISLNNPSARKGEKPRAFFFDEEDFYTTTASTIVERVLEGYNGTIFAYGQTGTGKTYTMEGDDAHPGVLPRAFEQVFAFIKSSKKASFLEIYNEDIRDLLSNKSNNDEKLQLREHPESAGLSGVTVTDAKQVKGLMTRESAEMGSDGEQHIRRGKLNLVDLAGSERQAKTGATGDRLYEATRINLSLSALGNVISALVELADKKTAHIPYRDSKLTRLLQDSLGGNSKTAMVATLSPADHNYDETLSTLSYANRAKNIQQKAKINEDPKDALLRQFQDEISKLKAELDQLGGGGGVRQEGASVQNMSSDAMAMLEKLKLQQMSERKELELRKDMLEAEKQALLAKNDAVAKELEDKKKKTQEMNDRLKYLEEQLVQGNETLAERTKRLESELAMKKGEIEIRRQEAQVLQNNLDQQMKAVHLLKEKYNTIQDEANEKTKKLKKLWDKFQETKNELSKLTHDSEAQQQEMLSIHDELRCELYKFEALVKYLVPSEEKERIWKRLVFDESLVEWKISFKSISVNGGVSVMDVWRSRPDSIYKYQRPISYSTVVSLSNGAREPRHTNLLRVDLIEPIVTSLGDRPMVVMDTDVKMARPPSRRQGRAQ